MITIPITAEVTRPLQEDGVDTLFCSINCMKNPVKYIEYTHVVEEDYQSVITTKKSVVEYYSKDSHDIAIMIDFITRINRENNINFNLTMEDIKLLLENNGGFFLLKKERTEDKKGAIKHKIHLKPIELKSV
jgi:hypothetical protein